MIEASIVVVGLAAVAAAWDGFRRYIQTARINKDALDELKRVADAHARLELLVRTQNERMATLSLATRQRSPLASR